MGGMFFILGILLGGPLLVYPVGNAIYRFVLFLVNGDQGQIEQERQRVALENVILDLPETKTPSLRKRLGLTYPEVLLAGIAPLAGIAFVFLFSAEIKPFNLDYYPTLIPFIVLVWGAYWIARLSHEKLSDFSKMILTAGMLIGCVLYLFLGLHFISGTTLLGAMVFPFFAVPLFAPIPAMLYNIIQIKRMEIAHKPMVYVMAFGFVFFMLCIYNVLGFSSNSLILAFTQSEDFLFSSNRSGFFYQDF